MSLLASIATTYSTFVDESETTFCSFKIQLIVVPPIVKAYPMVLLLLSLSPIISESTYPCRTMFEPSKHNACVVVPLKYLRIDFTAIQCSLLDCSYTYSQLPLHVQYLALCTPLHTLSCQLLMSMEPWTCSLSLPMSWDTPP